MYKIIFIDIDGTLRNDKKEITDRTKNAIKQTVAKGIYVVISSGRYRKYTENVSKQALASHYVIACNGGEIYDYKNQKNIYENKIKQEAVIKLWDIAKKHDIQFTINSRDKRFVRNLQDNETDIVLKEPIEDVLKNHSTTQCILSSLELKKLQNIKEEVNLIQDVKIVNQSSCLVNSKNASLPPFFLDISCKDTSKGNAIKELCKYLNIDLKDSVAIGDSYNDLSMFEVVGHAVAMGNAPDEIRKIVDEVTATNNEDGVAKFLEEI